MYLVLWLGRCLRVEWRIGVRSVMRLGMFLSGTCSKYPSQYLGIKSHGLVKSFPSLETHNPDNLSVPLVRPE